MVLPPWTLSSLVELLCLILQKGKIAVPVRQASRCHGIFYHVSQGVHGQQIIDVVAAGPTMYSSPIMRHGIDPGDPLGADLCRASRKRAG
jgi:hypothetical protein